MEGSILGGSEVVVRGALSSSRLWLVLQEPNLATILIDSSAASIPGEI